MPTAEDLAKLATEVYKGNPTVGAMQDIDDGLQLDFSKASSLGFDNPPFIVWSGEEYNSDTAYLRVFVQSFTFCDNRERDLSEYQAVCVGE